MFKRIFILILFIAMFPIRDAMAGDKEAIIDKAMAGEELVLLRDYDGALKSFKKLQAEYPESPTGYFGELSIWQLKMFENEDKRFANEYRAIEEKADKVMMRLLKSKDILDTDLLICGAAYGMRGFFAVHEDEYFKALSLGLHALHILKRLKFRNPEFVDSDLGIGMYEYWRSVFTNRYWFLPFFPDKRKEGIKKIRRVMDKGLYSKELAASNLIFVLYNERQYKEAEQHARVMLQKYPSNIILRMLLGRVLFFEKRYEESIVELEKVLKLDPNITKAYYVMAFPYFNMKNMKKSRELMERFLETNPTEDMYRSSAYYWLGRVDEDEKNFTSAIKNYKISYELYKKDNDAKRRYLKLKEKEGYK